MGAALAAACGLVAVPASGHPGSPADHTTLEQTIRRSPGEGYRPLVDRPGEPYLVREELGNAEGGRSSRRRALSFFGQLTDPQIVDEMSPARVEFLDPAGGDVNAAHRPQEAFGPFVWDQAVRNLNRNLRSRVRQGNGARSTVQHSLLTGDLADNQQLNETVWYRDVLLGRAVDPFSGKSLSPTNECPQAITPQQRQDLNSRVQRREYTGVQDYDDYPGPRRKHRDYWDPDEDAPAGSPYQPFPEYPGLMNRAQMRFQPEGISTPWFVARGNHDGLVQGNVPANRFFNTAAVGCQKVFPEDSPNRQSKVGSPGALELNSADTRRTKLFAEPLGGAGTQTSLTPPDPNRRFVSKREFKRLQTGGDNQHGFGYVDPAENRASAGSASYYGFDRPTNLRFISIDSVAEGGGSSGNLDDPQYRWLARELDRNSSVELDPDGRVRRDGDSDRLIVLYGHHTLASMNNDNLDEAAGPCTPANPAGCDPDPRPSTPIHRGLEGPQSVRSLLLRYPNVVAYVAGHTHQSDATPYSHPSRKGGFWEINTPSLVDPAQQLRTIELMDNRDGTLSFFGTIVDHAAPVRPPRPGSASGFSIGQLASLAREVAFNDPQTDEQEALGTRRDRNVELVLKNPRRLRSSSSGGGEGEPGTINGTPGSDVLYGTSGNDVINCGAGNDRVYAGSGNDIVNCGPGDDVIYGGSGNDTLRGEEGNDRIYGESGEDRIDGGSGNDSGFGGSGGDTFVSVERRQQD